MITLREYQNLALERLNPTIAKPNKEGMRYACMGLLEESGEIVAELRKPLCKGNYHEKPLDKQSIVSELGDLMWYIALICRNNDIDINNLEREIPKEKEEDRVELIKDSIKIGQVSGKITQRYIKYRKGEIKKEKLEKALRRQYKNVLKLASELNISIEDILETNLKKVNSRYNEKGQANISKGEER